MKRIVGRVWWVAGIVFAAPRGLEAQPAAPTGDCFGSGDCCSPHFEVGCDDVACCGAVCAVDLFCCQFEWDNSCVVIAEQECGALCGGLACPGTGDCCAPHETSGCSDDRCCELVCTQNAACCSGTWSAECVTLAQGVCDQCEPPIVCPMQGNCCAGNLTPGCDREFCCDFICNVLNGGDEFCCRSEWDDVCAREAFENCPNICVCERFGDLNADERVNLRDLAGFQNCFAGSGAELGDACACADYDADDDADLADFHALHTALESP